MITREARLKRYDSDKRELMTYKIYTKEEADLEGVKYVYWVDSKPGDYALTDDNYVLEIVRINGPYKRRNNDAYEWRTCLGGVFSNSKFNIGPRLKAREDPKYWVAGTMRRRKLQLAVATYAGFIATKGYVTEEEWTKCSKIYRQDNGARLGFKRILKEEQIKNMIAEEVVRILNEAGLTAAKVVKKHSDIIDNAIKAKQFGVAERANSRFIEMFDLMPNKVIHSKHEEVSFSHLLTSQKEQPQLESVKEVKLLGESDE